MRHASGRIAEVLHDVRRGRTTRRAGITGAGTGAGALKGARATLWISERTGLPVEFEAFNSTTTITEAFTETGDNQST